MKKWMITYSFLIGFLSLTICSHAAPVKAVHNSSSSKFAVKKTFPIAIKNKNDRQADCCAINHRTRFTLFVIPTFAVTENSASLILYYSCRDIVTARGVEKVLKDYLLHLFRF